MGTDTGFVYELHCVCGCNEGPQYVGQTRQNVEKRYRSHIDAAIHEARGEYNNPKAVWIREHGRENIRYTVLGEHPLGELDAAEDYWIRNLNTLVPHGKNARTGGHLGRGGSGEENPGAKLSEAQVRAIIDRIATDMTVTSRSLAREYHVTKTLILKIDGGDLWPDVPRPQGLNVLRRNTRIKFSFEEAQRVRERYGDGTNETVTQIARDYGVSDRLIQNIVKGKTWVQG